MSIAHYYQACMLSFRNLSEYLQLDQDNDSPRYRLNKDVGRFRLWAENTGAHRNGGRSSLDYRVREASPVREIIIKLLRDLERSLNDALSPNETISENPLSLESDSDSDSDSEESGRLDDCLLSVTNIINCLYNLSIAVRNPAPRDRLAKYAAIDVAHFEEFDRQHVLHMFPNAPGELIDRLGQANTRRRQLLKYHELHHKRIAGHGLTNEYNSSQYVTEPGDGDAFSDATITATVTTASDYIPHVYENTTGLDLDKFSEISYGSTPSFTRTKSLQVPPLPHPERSFGGTPFECPICFCLTRVTSRQSWKKHVYCDIRPYVCCYCPGTGKLFDSRSDWYEHEREIHRREWVCSSHGAFTSASLFRHHLENDHHGSLLDDQTRLRFMIDRAEQTIQSEQSCPLCGKDGLSPRGLRGHLGRHMQQIALFILGPGEEDDDEDVGCGDVDGDEDEDDDDDEEEGEVKEDDLIQEQETRGSEEEEAHLPEEQQRLLNVEPLQSTKDEGILFQTEQNNSDEIWRIHHTGEFTVCGDCWSRIVEPTPYSEYFDLIVKENGDKHKCDLEQEEWKQLWERRYRLWDFGEFLKMVGLKHKLEEIRLEKADTVEEMREKSVRRGLFPDERRRFRNLLALVEKEEGDVKYSLDRMFFTI